MALEPKSGIHKDSLDILLDKIPHMRDELLNMERALARFQKEAMELASERRATSKTAR
jgi:hypothetical protein